MITSLQITSEELKIFKDASRREKPGLARPMAKAKWITNTTSSSARTYVVDNWRWYMTSASTSTFA